MKTIRLLASLCLALVLLTGCMGEALTPAEALCQTDIHDLIGQTRKTVYDLYLLSDDQVIEEGQDVTLPFTYFYYPSGEEWARETWDVTLHFVPGATAAKDDQVVGGYTLKSFYGGYLDYQRATKAFFMSLRPFDGMAPMETELPSYEEHKQQMEEALADKDMALASGFEGPDGERAIVAIARLKDKDWQPALDGEGDDRTYVVSIDRWAEEPLSINAPKISLPRVISEKKMSFRRMLSDSAWAVLYWGLFILPVIGLILYFGSKIFARKKTIRGRFIKVDDGQDINARNFLAIPPGGNYTTQRRMNNGATPMNEEFLTTRKVLFALVDKNDKLLTLRTKELEPETLIPGQEYKVTYKGNRVLSIEKI